MTIVRNLGDLANQIDSSGTLGVGGGGTSATTTTAGFNALAPSQTGNSGKFLTTNGSTASWADLPPSITNVTPSSFDGNAGQSFVVTGLNFSIGCSTVFVGYDGITTYATTTTRNSSVSLTVVNSVDMPVSNETYSLKVINSDGSYAIYSGIDAGSVPSWTTASGSLGTWDELTSVSTSVTATDPDGGAITYSSNDIGSGSLTWLSINSSTGAITGTAPSVSSNTSYSFSVIATDNAGNTSSRSFSVSINNILTVNYLIVAGGGSGGSAISQHYCNGGGGAGGLLSGSNVVLNANTEYPIVVGAGGSAIQVNAPNNGNNSTFNSLTAIGGGGGGSNNTSGQTGGSGGGGSLSGQTGGSGTSGQGNNGGDAYTGGTATRAGGGGGGAGANGGTGVSGIAGAGGIGLASSITGTSTYYAGGGGGAACNGTGASGGNGGGGAGVSSTSSGVNGVSGTANTGGGGGAYSPNNGIGGGDNMSGAGGSGVVIIRTLSNATATTGSPTITTDGSYNIYKFTSSGSITF